MGLNPNSGRLISKLSNFYRDLSSLPTRSARSLILKTDYALYRLSGLTEQKCYRSLDCKRWPFSYAQLKYIEKNMASILVYYIILTDIFEKIGLIRILKVVFKL